MLARLLMTALFFSFGSPAAAPAAQAATEHAPLFEAAAQEVDVPPELTQAIARVESGGTPYALNIEGRGYFFDSKEEALAAASEAQAAGQSFDSGIMQVFHIVFKLSSAYNRVVEENTAFVFDDRAVRNQFHFGHQIAHALVLWHETARPGWCVFRVWPF